MKIRTFLYVTIGFGLLSIIGLTAWRNAELLNSPFVLTSQSSVQTFWVILFMFLAGFGLAVMFGLIREGHFMFERWRRFREGRRMTATEERFYEGLQAVAEGREEDALKRFRAVLDSDPTHFNALLKMGEVLCAMGRTSEAIQYHRRAQDRRPEDSQPLYALATDYEVQGDPQKAKATLAQIIELKPRSALRAYRHLRAIHMKEGDWAEALEAHNRIERILAREGRKDEKEKKAGVGLRYSLARKHQQDGKSKVAINLYRRLVKEEPMFIPAYLRLGAALREAGDEQEAVGTWNRGFETTGSPMFLSMLEEHFLDQEQPMSAIEALRHCVAIAEKDTLPRFFLGKLYYRLEMLDEALDTLGALQGRTSYAPTLHYLIGRIHERRGNTATAADNYRAVIKELELVKLAYRCLSCGATLSDWADRCPKCEEWNSVEIDFREDISLQDLGVASAPIYSNLT